MPTNPVPTKRNANKTGIVVLLDALGVGSRNIEDAHRFIEQRQKFFDLTTKKMSELDDSGDAKMDDNRLSKFQFGDTMLLAYESQEEDWYLDLRQMLVVLRAGFVHALDDQLLLRGSVAIGEFIADNDTNTAVGPAVSDAAEWYEAADWAGIILTPEASMHFRSKRANATSFDWLAVDYDVPLSGKDAARRETVNLLACNWVKYLKITKTIAKSDAPTKLQWVQRKLSERGIPKGTERKAFNTLEFHRLVTEHMEKVEKNKMKATARRRR